MCIIDLEKQFLIYRRHYELMMVFRNQNFMVTWFTNLRNFKKERLFFAFKFIKRIGYNLYVVRQSACLVFNPIMVDNYIAIFNYTINWVGRS